LRAWLSLVEGENQGKTISAVKRKKSLIDIFFDDY